MRRKKMNKAKSKKLFTRTAGRPERNYATPPMRGGYRL